MRTRCCAACQTGTPQRQAMRSRPLRVRLGMVMAIVIEFYVPQKFRKLGGKWIPPEQRGTIIRFPAPEKKSV